MAIRSPLINVMVKTAEAAAKGLRRDFGEIEHLQVSRKGPADFVSNADLKSQKIIREDLSKARPSFGLIMEENDVNPEITKSGEFWIVDPLDGTTNFLHGLPHWAISIAAMREGEVIAGIVYDPIKEELFWADKGCGAFSGNKRLRVSARSDLADCLIGTGIPFKGIMHRAPHYEKEFHAIMPNVAGIRRMGSAALDLAYVAAGRLDAFWESGLGVWDSAAGLLIAREAGGIVSPLDVGADPLLSGTLMASNAEIHEQVLGMLRSARKS